MIDAHLHLAQYPAETVEREIAAWRAGGVESVIAVATDVRSCHRTLELQRRHPDFVRAALGWHPEQALPKRSEREEIFALIQNEQPSLAAIGEVGLPHYSQTEHLAGYQELLAEFAVLAAETGLPLVLHAVHDKAGLALQVLERHSGVRAHFHWLKADAPALDALLAAGHIVSVTPEVCWRERDQELARRVPLAQLLIETDGPWPYEGPFAGRPTTPLFLNEVRGAVARLKGITAEELDASCRQTVRAFYGASGKS
ncbi:TatD family hydrolase [Tumebacillus sp. DT12]|uniref:TatD family hydrolase n=1 Tax=Tumebacillus lacus TaxID=2995335 RepID=A0ABT3X248_9BACL|nr:TatD family hydrolase [Tumebacillus lacus]MCX7570990.1 TatD family hydrolase [Tumebacillus lacus]